MASSRLQKASRQRMARKAARARQGRPQGSPPRIGPTPARTKTTKLPAAGGEQSRVIVRAGEEEWRGGDPCGRPCLALAALRAIRSPACQALQLPRVAVSLYGRGRKSGGAGTLAVALARHPLSCALSACSRLLSCLIRSLATSPCCPLVLFFSLRYTTRAMNGHISDRRAALS